MKLCPRWRAGATRLRLPVALLAAFLQRLPALRFWESAAAGPGGSPLGLVLRAGAVAAASLGAVDALAGATTVVSSRGMTLTTPAGQAMPTVTFTISGTQAQPGSWVVYSAVPPGLNASGLTGPGYANVAALVLAGTPTTPGTYYLDIAAFEDPAAQGLVSPQYLFTLVVTAPAPAFTAQPVGQTIAPGTTVVFTAAATGALSYQWYLGSAPLSGATSPRLVVAGASAANAGNYTCVATNSSGSTTSQAAALTVTATPNPGRLGNISVLSPFTAGQTLTIGYVSGGAGTSGSESLLIRATGPSLAAVSGLTGTMADPKFQVLPLGQTTVVAANDNWGTPASNVAPVNAADAATGAFALLSGSADAAIVTAAPPGPYTVQVSGTGPGTALTEVYDDTPVSAYTASTPRLVNVSCNNQIAAGGSLTVGFYVAGVTAKTVLIRASGPTLQANYGVTGAMANPQVVVYSGPAVLAANAGWGGDPQLAAAANAVGAFPFASATSLDSAVLITLAPGAYTAVVSSATGGGGVALAEVYEDP